MDEKVYRRYRTELQHEDDLINHRLNWFFGAQGLLFAALGLAMKENLYGLAATVMGVGLLSSVLTLISVRAAIECFQAWLGRLRSLKREETCVDHYPQLQREPSRVKRGFAAPRWLPVVFVAAWALLALVYAPKMAESELHRASSDTTAPAEKPPSTPSAD